MKNELKGDDIIAEFVSPSTAYCLEVIVLFHNLKGFDGMFIINEL